MLVREKIQRQLLRTPWLSGREIARRLQMTPGQVAGHLASMEDRALVERRYDVNKGANVWAATGSDTKVDKGQLWAVGNIDFKMYLEDGTTKLQAEAVCRVLRAIMPSTFSRARAFQESVYLPVARNKVIIIGDNDAT